jgi:hypothetical protein
MVQLLGILSRSKHIGCQNTLNQPWLPIKSGQLGKKRETTTIALLFKGIYNTLDGLMSGMMGQCGLFLYYGPLSGRLGNVVFGLSSR